MYMLFNVVCVIGFSAKKWWVLRNFFSSSICKKFTKAVQFKIYHPQCKSRFDHITFNQNLIFAVPLETLKAFLNKTFSYRDYIKLHVKIWISPSKEDLLSFYFKKEMFFFWLKPGIYLFRKVNERTELEANNRNTRDNRDVRFDISIKAKFDSKVFSLLWQKREAVIFHRHLCFLKAIPKKILSS